MNRLTALKLPTRLAGLGALVGTLGRTLGVSRWFGGAAVLLGSGKWLAIAILAGALLWTHSRYVLTKTRTERDTAIHAVKVLAAEGTRLSQELTRSRASVLEYQESARVRDVRYRYASRVVADVGIRGENHDDDPNNTLDLAVPESIVKLVRPDARYQRKPIAD